MRRHTRLAPEALETGSCKAGYSRVLLTTSTRHTGRAARPGTTRKNSHTMGPALLSPNTTHLLVG